MAESHLSGFIIPLLRGIWRADILNPGVNLAAFAPGLSLLLPCFKSMIVGWQWARRMPGF